MSVELVCDRCQDGAPMNATVLDIGSGVEHMGGNPIVRAHRLLPKDWTMHVHPNDHPGTEMISVVLCPVCTQAYNDWLNPDYTATQQTSVNQAALERRRKDRKTPRAVPTQQTATEGDDREPCDWCGGLIANGAAFRDAADRPYCNEDHFTAKQAMVGGGPGPKKTVTFVPHPQGHVDKHHCGYCEENLTARIGKGVFMDAALQPYCDEKCYRAEMEYRTPV